VRRIGVAVIGTGFMCWVHIEALRRAGVTIVGILGSTREKSQVACERLDVPKAYASFDEVLADSEVDSIHINTPNRFHFDMASRALRAGKHVMCEKPLAMNATESEELVRIASQHPQLAAGVNYNIRYYPLCLEARDRVRSGCIGEVFHITGSYCQDWLLLPTDYNWRVLAEEGGRSRAVSDVGTHWLDLVQAISGLQIESVCADLKTVHPVRLRPKGGVETFKSKEADSVEREPVDITTDDYGSVMLRFRGGSRGNMHVSQVNAGRKNCVRFEIAGATQTLAWNSEKPNEMWIGHRDRSNELLIRDPALMSDLAGNAADYPGGHNEGYADTFKQCFRAFYEYIDADNFEAMATYPTFEDGHREIVLVDAILESNDQHGWVRVENQ
jgi:predicted dehydrogenase